MEAVSTDHEVALHRVRRAVLDEVDPRPVGVQAVQGDVVDLEAQLGSGVHARRDEVLHHLLLAVHGDAASGVFDEVDAVAAQPESQDHPGVRQPLLVHPLADTGLAQRLGCAVLQDAGPNSVFDVGAVAALEHDRLDALQMQQVREQQARGAGADDSYLRAHHRSVPNAHPRVNAAHSGSRRSPIGARVLRADCAHGSDRGGNARRSLLAVADDQDAVPHGVDTLDPNPRHRQIRTGRGQFRRNRDAPADAHQADRGADVVDRRREHRLEAGGRAQGSW